MQVGKNMGMNFIILFLGLILLAGCNGIQHANVETQQPTQFRLGAVDTPALSGLVEVTATPTSEIITEPAQPTVTPESAQSITETPELAGNEPPTQPAVKAGLTATDPGSVQLASGRPQLIEFFAFW